MLGNSAVAQFAVAQFPSSNGIALVGRCVAMLRGRISPTLSTALAAHGTVATQIRPGLVLNVAMSGLVKATLHGKVSANNFSTGFFGRIASSSLVKSAVSATTALSGRTQLATQTLSTTSLLVRLTGLVKAATQLLAVSHLAVAMFASARLLGRTKATMAPTYDETDQVSGKASLFIPVTGSTVTKSNEN